jgi:hypothetical protein
MATIQFHVDSFHSPVTLAKFFLKKDKFNFYQNEKKVNEIKNKFGNPKKSDKTSRSVATQLEC